MVDCPYFKTNSLNLTKDLHQNISARDSFTILMCVKGNAQVANDFGKVEIKKGETILIPAESTTLKIVTNDAQLLEVTI